MSELPILQTVRNAYRFTFLALGYLLRLSWLPLGLVAILQILAGFFDLTAPFATENTVPVILTTLAFVVLSAGVLTSIAVAVHRMVLFGVSDERSLAFGGSEWRFIGMGLMFGAGFIALSIVGGLLGVVIGMVGGIREGALQPLFWITLLPLMGLGVFLAVRLWPVYPIIVSRGRIDLPEAWHLTRGRFWRLLGIGFLTYLPLLGLGLVLRVIEWLAFIGATTPAELMARTQVLYPVIVILSLAQAFLSTVVYAAALCFAYKTLNGIAAGEMIAGPNGSEAAPSAP